MAYATLAVVGLSSSERYFSAFEIEVHKDNTGNNKAASATVDGIFNTTAARWEQKSPVFFRSLTLGTTYYLRVRVQPKGKGAPSAWSSWWTEVPGDVTSPSPDYGQFAIKPVSQGAFVYLNPTNVPSDIDYYEIFQSLSNNWPTAGSDGTDWSKSAAFALQQLNSDPAVAVPHYVWVRATDTSGNHQGWCTLYSYIPLVIYNVDGTIADGLVTGNSAGITVSARDNNKNLLGNPKMSGSGALPAWRGSAETWVEWRSDGASSASEYRNGYEIRLPAPVSGSTQVIQWKSYRRFVVGQKYSFRVSVRKDPSVPTPNGNFIVYIVGVTGSARDVGYLLNTTTPGSAILTTPSLVYDTFVFTPLPGATAYYICFVNTSTNADLYITQAQLNKGAAISDYTEDTWMNDAAVYAPENYCFVYDMMTGASELLSVHNPSGFIAAGGMWISTVKTGAAGSHVNNESSGVKLHAVAGGNLVVAYNDMPSLTDSYSVRCFADISASDSTSYVGVVARYKDANNFYYATWKLNADVEVGKYVAGVKTVIGTFNAASGKGGFGRVSLTISGSTLRAESDSGGGIHDYTDASIAAAPGAEYAGIILYASGTTYAPGLDGVMAYYVKGGSVANAGDAPPAPPPPPPDPPPGGGCCTGEALIDTRGGQQLLERLYVKYLMGTWTEEDDLHTYDFEKKAWSFEKPEWIRRDVVPVTRRMTLENGLHNRASLSHGLFSKLVRKHKDFKRIADMRAGRNCLTAKLTLDKVVSNVRIVEDVAVYMLEIPRTHTYAANGILCHNLRKGL